MLCFMCCGSRATFALSRMVLGLETFNNNTMDLKDYAELRALEHNKHDGWGSSIALYIIAAVIVLAWLVYIWQQNCSEKVQLATGLATITGRVNAIEPAVTAQGNNLYQLNGAFSATAQGVRDFKQCTNEQLYQLNDEVFYNPAHRGARGGNGCGDGNRVFKQSQTYNLASTSVTVDDYCRSC